MSGSKSTGAGMKIISVILGALVTGFMWRCRGESGWGSSWGLFSVGLVLTMLIYHFYGKRRGMKFELVPIGALMMGLGVTGYATVIEQMSGKLYSDLPYKGVVVNTNINPASGMTIILLMGFTLVPLFAFFIGTLFSEKEYKLKHYVTALVLFYVVSIIMKATVSPFILKAINPDQVEWAMKGLLDSGFDYASPAKAYLAHFGDRGWTQEIPFFENYYMSIEHISDAIATIAVALYPLIAFKDKTVPVTALFIEFFTAISTTACSFLIIADYGSGFAENLKNVPRCLAHGAGWGLWEFSTGFAVGLFTMIIIALLPKKLTDNNVIDTELWFKGNTANLIYTFAAMTFVFGVVPFRVLGIRTGKLFDNLGLIEDGGSIGEIVCIVVSVIFGLVMLKVISRNVFANGRPLRKNVYDFVMLAFPAYLGMCWVAYFFLNHAYLITWPYSKMTSVSETLYILTGPEYFTEFFMLIVSVIILVIYIPVRKKLNKEN